MHLFSNINSTIIAWIIAVTFAFFANKWFVFEKNTFINIWTELWKFLSGRIFTGILELIIMYIAIDVCHSIPIIWKVITNIVVIILNYILGKMAFIRKDDNESN